ncbi:MAG: hypothetical protein ACRDS9_26560 [Pseudonocardiaceae bacterium]
MTVTPPGPADVRRVVWSLREAIRVAAREGFGAAMVERAIPGLSLTDRDVEPIAGVRAAVLARDVAVGRLRYYAERARAGGGSWDDVAEACGLSRDDAGRWSRAELAYLHLIEDRPLRPEEEPRWRQPTAGWRCDCCGRQVMDRGPFEAAPYNNETGHAPDCARHTAEIAAYRADPD